MGLFDSIGKKTAICKMCGAEFEKKILSGDNLCTDCHYKDIQNRKAQMSMQSQLEGIQSYYKDMPKRYRTLPADINTIMAERNRILEKYRRSDVVTAEDFRNAYINTNVWGDEEHMAFMRRVYQSKLITHKRVSFAQGKFIVSHRYDGVVVDFDDVFAVTVVQGNKAYSSELDGAYLCAMFTNNPYFPVIAMAFNPNVKMGFLSTKAKFNADVLNVIASAIQIWCKNLTYPVMWIKDMRKLVKQEKCVRGNINIDMMNELLSCAQDCGAPFWGSDSVMSFKMPFGISRAIIEYGYRSLDDLRAELMVDKQSEKVWMHYVSRCDQEVANGQL